MAFDLQLPEGCPGADAREYEGTVFRVVKTDPPTAADLQTYLELGLLPKANLCKRGSVSLYSTAIEAQQLAELRPYIGEFVASISLTPAHGKVGGPSASGHIDWWPYAGMRNPADLTVI
ncbi:hypothetical protein [Burkholderia cenocepacia]|uniref:hypothetical protein n=1 Tax=Burkholderia cenocepacia TaxID=95486 RepID=UPI0028B3D71F|nr:hypothetical protein [Burkholderia cenocepacia]MDT6993191.1 hypothetical protein [Burkholderia cenocepacia]